MITGCTFGKGNIKETALWQIRAHAHLVDKVIGAPEDQLLNIGEVHQHPFEEPPHSFASFVCELCGDMTVEPYGRILGEKKVCIPCRESAVRQA